MVGPRCRHKNCCLSPFLYGIHQFIDSVKVAAAWGDSRVPPIEPDAPKRPAPTQRLANTSPHICAGAPESPATIEGVGVTPILRASLKWVWAHS